MKKTGLMAMLSLNAFRAKASTRTESVVKGQTDISRWRESASFPANWSSRAAIAADMISGYRSVCDIGCGMQDLRRELSEGVEYFPMDVVKRTPDTIVCEINKRQLPLEYIRRSLITSVLGVVEYLTHPEWLFSEVAGNCDAMIVSYCISDSSEPIVKRKERGWMNHFSDAEFEALLRNADFTIEGKQAFSKTQNLWLCKKRTPVDKM